MNTILMGAFGEQTAAKYLRENGYRILSANYRTGAGELDIVAEKGSVLSTLFLLRLKQGQPEA